MAGATPDPLTPEQAKERLREAATGVGLGAWMRRRPYHVLLVAFAAGAAAAIVPRIGHSTLRLASALLLTSLEYDLLTERGRRRLERR